MSRSDGIRHRSSASGPGGRLPPTDAACPKGPRACGTRPPGIVPTRPSETRASRSETLSSKPIHWPNVITLFSVAILVGVELVGAGWAAGWALGGLLALGQTISHV